LASLKSAVAAAGTRYHRLLFIVGGDDQVRSRLLQTLATELSGLHLMVSVAVAEALLPEPRAGRVAGLGPLLEELTASAGAPVVCLDAIEVLFLPELRVDVLGRLQQLSRNRTFVVNWPGTWDGQRLTYADASHPEFFEASVDATTVFTVPGFLSSVSRA